MLSEDLIKQLSFISELEKLKTVYRANKTLDKNRYENSAEHSWHIALMAVILIEHSTLQDIDMLKVLKMLLIHDIVEIDVGDTFLYYDEMKADSIRKEKDAAKRIFGLLPEKQSKELIELWNEFEERKTKEAIFAASMDGLQPLINHFLTTSENENPYKMTKTEVVKKKEFIKEASPTFWEIALGLIEKSVAKGLYFAQEPKNTSTNSA
jgi:putative hydrolases of HD superfamily